MRQLLHAITGVAAHKGRVSEAASVQLLQGDRAPHPAHWAKAMTGDTCATLSVSQARHRLELCGSLHRTMMPATGTSPGASRWTFAGSQAEQQLWQVRQVSQMCTCLGAQAQIAHHHLRVTWLTVSGQAHV